LLFSTDLLAFLTSFLTGLAEALRDLLFDESLVLAVADLMLSFSLDFFEARLFFVAALVSRFR